MTGMADLAREGILVAGAGRAILLQIADPSVAAGVARHSDFGSRTGRARTPGRRAPCWN